MSAALRVFGWLRTAWLIFGIYLVLLVAFEGCASVWVRYAIPREDAYDESNADALAGADWLEGYLRELGRIQQGWQSYVYWKRRPFEGEYFNIDAQGRRRTWRDPALASGVEAATIFVQGASTVWGRGARDDYTIPSSLAKTLAAQGLTAEVVNLGQGAYVHTQDLITLMLELRAGRVPDVVVFYGGIADVFSAYQQKLAGIPMKEWRRRLAFEDLPRAFFRQVLEDRASYRVLAHYLRTDARRRAELELSDGEQRQIARDVVALVESNLRLARELGRRYGFTPLFYWQPVLFWKENRTPHESEILAYTHRIYPGLGALFDEVAGLVSSPAFRARNPGFRDVSRVFASDPAPYYLDFAHISGVGNAIVAAAIATDVSPLIATAPRAPGN